MTKNRLQTVLIVPFIIQIVAAIGIVGILSWRNERRAVDDIVARLRVEISARVEERIATFVQAPLTINQINTDAIAHGDLQIVNAETMEYLWLQYQLFDSVGAIQFSLEENGHYLGIVKVNPDQPAYFQYRDETTDDHLYFYTITGEGEQGELFDISENEYEPRQRPWYTDAVAKGGPRWGEIEPAHTLNSLLIDNSQPAYDGDGNLVGVLVVDILLEQIDEFLETIEVSNTGLVFMMENTGELIADSVSEPSFIVDPETDEPQRILATDSANPLIRASAEEIITLYGALDMVDSSQQFEMKIDGHTHYLQVTPFTEETGLDWLIVVVLPEKDFTAQITANNWITVLVVIFAAGSVIIIGLLTARRVTTPILQMNESARALAAGNHPQPIEVNSQDEVGELAQSFNKMARELQNSFALLEAKIEEQQVVEDALRQSEEKYRTLVETADDGIILVDMDGNRLLYNEAYHNNLGYTAEEIEQIKVLDMVHPDDLPVLVQMEELYHVQKSVTLEYRVKCKDGSWAYRLAKSTLIMDKHGQPESILTISHDITERKEMEQKIQQQERLSAVGHLAAGIAHDFNNILSSMILYNDILLHLPDMPPKANKYLNIVASQNLQAANLVQQILDFGRRSALDKQVTNLIQLLQELITLTRRTFPENISLALSHTEEQHFVLVDATRIQQVIINLMLNARDAMPGGGVLSINVEAVTITPDTQLQIANLTPGRWQKITIADTGTGISPENLSYLFEPFFTTKEPGTGTGLGLAQVYGIIQQHDGAIDVDSRVGTGTTFTLYLSYVAPDIPAPVSDSPEAEVPFGNQEQILIVEDSAITREAIAASLETLNYQVVEAENGRHAINILKQNSREIALIICDMLMPTMSGLDFLKTMQAEGFTIPTIILSGYLPNAELDELRTLGMSDWITKPPKIEHLAQTIARNLT